MKQTDLSGKAQTVLGPVDADSLGVTLFHEHLLVSMAAWYEEPAVYVVSISGTDHAGELMDTSDVAALLPDGSIIILPSL